MSNDEYYLVKLVKCSNCDGTGNVKLSMSQFPVTCPLCRGEKVVPEYVSLVEVFGELWVKWMIG